MVDRILIIILILFLVIGGTWYEHYARERGEVGPVARLIDFTNFGKTDSPFQSRNSRKMIKFNSQEELNLLREKHQRLEEQRAQLVLHRRELLSQLIDINGQIVTEAQSYQHAIEQDRDSFLDRFPELKPIGSSIIAAYGIQDPVQRGAQYQEIKQRLNAIIQEFATAHPEYSERLNHVLDEIDQVVNQEDQVLAACGDPVTCIDSKLDNLDGELETVSGEILTSAKKDIETIAEMTNALRKQYEILGQNFAANDEQVKRNDELIAGELKQLAENLITVTEADLKQVMDTYDEVQEQQNNLLANLALHQARVREAEAETDRRAKEVLARLKVPRMDFERLLKVYDNVKAERKELFVKFETNEFKLQQITREQWSDDSNLFDRLVQNASVDINKLIQDRKYAEQRAANSRLDVLPSGSRDLKDFQRNNDLRMGSRYFQPQSIKGRDSLQTKDSMGSRTQDETSEQTRRLRDKARDQGF